MAAPSSSGAALQDDAEKFVVQEPDENAVVGYLSFVVVLDDDKGITADWKCWEYVEASIVLWELGRVYYMLHKDTTLIASWLLQHWSQLNALFGRVGLNMDSHILMSLKRCKCRDVSPTIYHRKEARLTTVGLLSLLSFWATLMRAISSRDAALRLTAPFLGVSTDWIKEEIVESLGIIYDNEVLLCQDDVDTPTMYVAIARSF